MTKNGTIITGMGFLLCCVLMATCIGAQDSEFTNFISGLTGESEAVSKGSVRISSRILDQDGHPIEGVTVQIGTSTPGNWDPNVGHEELVVSRALNREWDGIMSLDLKFYKDGYRSPHLQFGKGQPLSNQSSGTIIDGVMVHDEDIIMFKRIRNVGLFISTVGTNVLEMKYSKDGSYTFIIHPETGSKIENLLGSPGNEDILSDPTTKYIRPDFVSAPGIERRSVNEFGNVTYLSPADLQLVITLCHASEGDGFVIAAPKDQAKKQYFPDDLSLAPESGYSHELRFPVEAFKNPKTEHFFYFKIDSHFGKGLYTQSTYDSDSGESPSASFNIQMVANPNAGNRNVMTQQEPF
ncbi:hypothetical protein BH09SUM1_BH09SUM1_09870 [soil metagenome]